MNHSKNSFAIDGNPLFVLTVLLLFFFFFFAECWSGSGESEVAEAKERLIERLSRLHKSFYFLQVAQLILIIDRLQSD